MVINKALTLIVGASLVLTQFSIPNFVLASEQVKIESASEADLARAAGHWHRARTHMMSALREFDKGNELVNPAAVLDAQAWRSHMLNRIIDIDRVLSPQPRATESGVRYDPAPELLGQKYK